jgi:hypothetical protein
MDVTGSTSPSLSQATMTPHPEEGVAKEEAIKIKAEPKIHGN